MRLRLARKLELRMLEAAAMVRGRFSGWIDLPREERRRRLTEMLAEARVRRQTHRRAFRRVWKAETR